MQEMKQDLSKFTGTEVKDIKGAMNAIDWAADYAEDFR